MNRVNRFAGYGIENEEPKDLELNNLIENNQSEQPIEVLVEESGEINSELDATEQDGSDIQTAMESLEVLAASIESLITSGVATKETSQLIDIQMNSILFSMGCDNSKGSLENFNNNHLDHLNASLESVKTWFQRYGQAFKLARGKYFVDLKNLLTNNDKIAAKYADSFSQLRNKLKSAPKDQKVNISYSGAGYFFNVLQKDPIPDFDHDMNVSNYIVNQYTPMVISTIEKATAAIAAADHTSVNGVEKLSKQLAALGHPVDKFKTEYLNKRIFGPTVLTKDEHGIVVKKLQTLSGSSKNPHINAISEIARKLPVIESSDKNIFDKLGITDLDFTINNEMEVSISDLETLIGYGEKYIKMIVKANEEINKKSILLEKIWDTYVDKMVDLRDVEGLGWIGVYNELQRLLISYEDSFKHPLKEELSRMIKVVARLNGVLTSTIGRI